MKIKMDTYDYYRASVSAEKHAFLLQAEKLLAQFGPVDRNNMEHESLIIQVSVKLSMRYDLRNEPERREKFYSMDEITNFIIQKFVKKPYIQLVTNA